MLPWFVTLDFLCEEIWEDEDQAIDKDELVDGNQEVGEDIFNSTAIESTSGNFYNVCFYSCFVYRWSTIFLKQPYQHFLNFFIPSFMSWVVFQMLLWIIPVWSQNVYTMRKHLDAVIVFRYSLYAQHVTKTYKFEDCVTVCGSK